MTTMLATRSARRRTIAFTVLDGRLPTGRSEVALGRRTLAGIGAGIGDSVDFVAADGSGEVTMEVVGIVATPLVESSDPGLGAAMTAEGLEFSRMDVMSLRRFQGSWRGLLTGDIRLLAQSLQASTRS